MRYAQLAVLLLTVTWLAAPVVADLCPIGDQLTTGSWDQGFFDNGQYGGVPVAIDAFAVRMVAGQDGSGIDMFKDPALKAFSAPGWAMLSERTVDVPLLASAGGTAQTSFYWTFHFAGEARGNPLQFDYAVFAAGQEQALASVLVMYDGNGGWSFGASNWLPDTYEAGIARDPNTGEIRFPGPVFVPVPGALLLGAMGLGLVGWTRRRLA